MFKIRLFTFATCLTLGGAVLPALALELSTPLNSSNNSNNSNNSKSSLDRSDLNLHKTRPEFTQPDLRNPIPLLNSSPSPSPTSNSSPSPIPSPTPNNNPSPTPSVNSSPANNANPSSTPNPTVSPTISPTISPITPASPPPNAGRGTQGFGDRRITPTINTIPGANRPEFQVPDLRLPSAPSPTLSPTPSPSPTP